MKKRFILCMLFIACISTKNVMAQAADVDSTIVHENTVVQNQLPVMVTAKIYPNPVRDELHIDGLNAKVKTHISISSAYGKVVYQSRTNGSDTYIANVQKLRPGIYYITIKADGESMLLKFLKEQN